MKALLVKDFSLMLQRGKILLFLIAWGVIMTFVMDNGSFVVGWIVMIAVITSISTISYDEYDNCMPFLMSLPVTRRVYAVEKYLFSLLCGAAFWIISVLILAVCSPLAGKAFSLAEDLPGTLLPLAATLIILAVTIPPQLKWGAEKGRIVLLVVFAVIGAGAFILSRPENSTAAFSEKLSSLSMGGVLLAVLAAGLLLTAVSVAVSVRIMEKKEF